MSRMVIISETKEPEINIENCHKHREMLRFGAWFWKQSKDTILDDLRAHYKRCEEILKLMKTHRPLNEEEKRIRQYAYRFIYIARRKKKGI
jgi:hypothetical protein